eukprot:1157770-Pelagomonas_calceolata.AAC.8
MPRDSPLQKLYTSSRALRIRNLLLQRGLNTVGDQLRLLLGNAHSKWASDSIPPSDEGGAAPGFKHSAADTGEAAGPHSLKDWFLAQLAELREQANQAAEVVADDLPSSLLKAGTRQRLVFFVNSVEKLWAKAEAVSPSELEVLLGCGSKQRHSTPGSRDGQPPQGLSCSSAVDVPQLSKDDL